MTKLSLLLAASTMWACTDESASRADTGNSVDAPIVSSSPPYTTLALNASPNVRIGTVGGDERYVFSRVVFAAGLSDGRIAVVDRGSNDIRWYANDGSHLLRAGGRGEGPGEMLAPASGVLLAGDTLAVFDARNQRLTWFSPDGQLARTHRFEATSAFAVALGDLGGGQPLVIEHRATLNLGGSDFNYARDSLLLMVPDSPTGTVDTISVLPGREAVTWVNYADGRPVATRQMELPFGEIALAQALGTELVVVPAGGSDLTFRTIDGSESRIARRTDMGTVEASSGLQARYTEAVVEVGIANGQPAALIREGLEARFELLPEGRAVPAFDRILVDSERGEVWLRDFVPPWLEGAAATWTVYGRDGRVEAQVTVHAGFDVMHVGDRRLVGVETDELGVEFVVRYDLA